MKALEVDMLFFFSLWLLFVHQATIKKRDVG